MKDPRFIPSRIGRIALQSATLSLTLMMVLAAAAQQTQDTYYPSAPQQDNQAEVSPSADPPSRVARLSIEQGTVSVEPASVNEFSPAQLNYPLTTGDRLWADKGSVAELEAGQLAVRLGESTDLTVTAMTDTLAQFGLGQGGVHLRTFALDDGTTTELDTPNIAVTVLQPGDVRVDVDPNGETTIVRVLSGQVEVDGNGVQQVLEAGQRMSFAGSNPVSGQAAPQAAPDGLDSFSTDRDQAYEGAESAEQADISPDTIGGADLEQNGSWSQDADYGQVWYPNVAAGWQPYCYGRWTWIAPWGWTWVESEPWGFAPFHYGRWAQIRGRWGWMPGPPVLHPVYSPGLVVFVHAGDGVSAWFPLGPNEPYAPWYHASTLYLNRVNVSNLHSRNVNEARTIYNTGNRALYANPLGSQRFANREQATVAVSQANFAAGRPVRSSMVHLQPQQVAGAAVLPHPMVTPERTMVAPAAARAVPPRSARPALASHQDTALRAGEARRPQSATGSQPNAQPAPIERRGYNPAGGAQSQPNQPAYRGNVGHGTQPNQPGTQPQQPNPATMQGGTRPANPVRGTEQLPSPSAPAPRAQTPNQAPNEGRSQGQERLYNRAVPPPARPSFDQQRQAIQNTDPGRPLGPQQLNNLRENRPVGQPQMREAAPHPAPAPRVQAPSRNSPPPAQRNSSPPSRSDGRH